MIKTKQIQLLLSCCLFIFTSLQAQLVQLTTGTVKMDKQNYQAIQAEVQPEMDVLKDAFETWLRKERDVNLKKKGLFGGGDMLIGEAVTVPAISDKQMDLYIQFDKRGKATELSLFGRFGYDLPISSANYPTEFQSMEDLVSAFLNDYLPRYYRERMEVASAGLEKLQDEAEKMEKKRSSNEAEIRKLQKENEELRKNLSENDQKRTAQQLLLRERESELSALKIVRKQQ